MNLCSTVFETGVSAVNISRHKTEQTVVRAMTLEH